MCNCTCKCECTPQQETPKLKDGDYVKDILTGEVYRARDTSSVYDGRIYPILLHPTNIGRTYTCTYAGLEHYSHKQPRFVKVDPPKAKRTTTITRYTNLFRSDRGLIEGKYSYGGLYLTQDGAAAGGRKLAKVTMVFEYEEDA